MSSTESKILKIKSAPVKTMQEEMGASIRKWIKAKGSLTEFQDETGLPRGSLRRLLQGEVVGTDMLFKVLKALGRYEILEQLLSDPPANPLDLTKPGKKPPTQVIKPVGFSSVKPVSLEQVIKQRNIGSLPFGNENTKKEDK